MHPCSFVIEWLSALVVGSFFTWAAAEWRFVLSLCIIHIIILRLVFCVSLGLHTLKLLVCFLVVLLVQRGFNWIIHDHYTQATSSVESVFDVFTAKQWKDFNNNTAIMPQNLLKASVHLLGWSHGVTIWLCWGFWRKHNPEREYFVLSSDSASCFYWEQLKFDVFCFFCWLVYFLFYSVQNHTSTLKLLLLKLYHPGWQNDISWNNLEKFWKWGWNSSQLCCGCCDGHPNNSTSHHFVLVNSPASPRTSPVESSSPQTLPLLVFPTFRIDIVWSAVNCEILIVC